MSSHSDDTVDQFSEENVPTIETAEQFEERVEAMINPPRFALVRFAKIKPNLKSQYLIKGLFPKEGLVAVYGPPKCGKSFWIFDASMHVALGWAYRGRRVKIGVVVYCALEGQHGFPNRVEAFRISKLADFRGEEPTFYLMTTSLKLVTDQK